MHAGKVQRKTLYSSIYVNDLSLIFQQSRRELYIIQSIEIQPADISLQIVKLYAPI